MKDNMNDFVIMASEPAPNKTPADVRNYYSNKKAEKDLADALAIVWNKFIWLEDEVYDHEEGTPEYIAACDIADEWGALMDEYEERIFMILRSEGIIIPETGYIVVLEPFMKRNGYINGAGWWVEDK